MVVAGRIYSMEEDQFVERRSLKIRNPNINYKHDCNDLVCSPNDD